MQQFDSEILSAKIRAHCLHMVERSNSSHIGSCLSVADILSVLYCGILRYDASNPEWPDRDKLVVSKGHCAAAVYATLALTGYFPEKELERFAHNGEPYSGHVTHSNIPGVELSTGSLGHGLPVALGFALAQRFQQRQSRTYVILSDGECDEGSNWEAILCAPAKKIHNLTVIVDYNKIQSFGRTEDVLDISPFKEKWEAFGWNVQEVDGHCHKALKKSFENASKCASKPSAVIAHTVKGKGVSFMEDKLEWHYRSPDKALLELALSEITEH